MLPYCGRTFRIKDRVRQIIDDKTGRMLNIPKDSLILDGVVCSGERSTGRWFCPREIHAYWREAWLRRADRPRPHGVNRGTALRPLSVRALDATGSNLVSVRHGRPLDPEAPKSPLNGAIARPKGSLKPQGHTARDTGAAGTSAVALCGRGSETTPDRSLIDDTWVFTCAVCKPLIHMDDRTEECQFSAEQPVGPLPRDRGNGSA